VMELLRRYSGLKHRMIAERFGGLDEGLASRDRGAIREMIATESKIRKWFQDLTRLSTESRFDSWRPRTVSQQPPQAPTFVS
jgi:hypothetical protein